MLLPAVISSSSSLTCHFTFLLFLRSCDTKQYLHSKTVPHKQEKHSPICMWPRFLCFLQFTLIECLLGFHIKEIFHWYSESSPAPFHPEPPIYGSTSPFKLQILVSSSMLLIISGNCKLVCHKTHFTSSSKWNQASELLQLYAHGEIHMRKHSFYANPWVAPDTIPTRQMNRYCGDKATKKLIPKLMALG